MVKRHSHLKKRKTGFAAEGRTKKGTGETKTSRPRIKRLSTNRGQVKEHSCPARGGRKKKALKRGGGKNKKVKVDSMERGRELKGKWRAQGDGLIVGRGLMNSSGLHPGGLGKK